MTFQWDTFTFFLFFTCFFLRAAGQSHYTFHLLNQGEAKKKEAFYFELNLSITFSGLNYFDFLM